MMRKYRAYNTKLKKMMQVLSIELDPELGGVEVWGKASVDYLTGARDAERDLWTWEECEVMDYVGKSSVNDKEFYESDIVCYQRNYHSVIIAQRGVIVRIPHNWGFIVLDPSDGKYYGLHEDWEVIGNIHENPELLEQPVKEVPGERE